MGVVNTSYTFTATDTITSAKMNNIIDDTIMTSTAISGTTLQVTPSGQLAVNSQGITSNELSASCVTSSKLSTAAGEIGAEWQSYTPIFTLQGSGPTNGNAVITGKYIKIGKVVHYRISYSLGSTTSFIGLTAMFATLPIIKKSSYVNYDPVGIVSFVLNTSSAPGVAISSGEGINIMASYTINTILFYTTLTQTTFSFTANSSNKILISGTYECE